MKVVCLKENLAKGLALVSRAAATRSTLPVLGNILLATDNGRLKLSATNLEIGITCWVGTAVEQDGATTVPTRTFVDLVNALPDEQVSLELNERTQTLNVKCGRFKNNVRGIEATEFPIIPAADGASTVQVSPDELRQAIERVAFAASTDEGRVILTGVLVSLDNDAAGTGRLVFAAADGFRISVRAIALGQPLPAPLSAIIPARALEELGRALKVSGAQFTPQGNPAGITIKPSGNQVLFHLDNVDMVSQLIDGAYPDINPLIPTQHTVRAVFATSDLSKVCRAANVFARENRNTIKLALAPANGTPGHITVIATSAETGDTSGVIDAAIEGNPIEIGFNVKYLIEMLSAIGNGQVVMEATEPTKQVLFRPVDDNSFVHVLAPMY